MPHGADRRACWPHYLGLLASQGLASCLALALGCASKTGDTTSGEAAVASLKQYCSSLLEIESARLVRCGAADNQSRAVAVLGEIDPGHCVRLVDVELVSGKAKLSEEAARTCLSERATEPCDGTSKTDSYLGTEFCVGVVKGVGGIGARCTKRFDCVGGAFCNASRTNCPGTCQRPFSSGEVVTIEFGEFSSPGGDEVCQGGLYVYSGKCSLPVGLHEKCRRPGEIEARCARGLFCASNGTCEQQRATGESCSESNYGKNAYIPCAPELFCIHSVCKPRVSTGHQCDVNENESAPCIVGDRCRPLEADQASGQCEPLRLLRESCEHSAQCLFSLYCDATTRACQKRRSAGPCTGDRQCLPSYSCKRQGAATSGDCESSVGAELRKQLDAAPPRNCFEY